MKETACEREIKTVQISHLGPRMMETAMIQRQHLYQEMTGDQAKQRLLALSLDEGLEQTLGKELGPSREDYSLECALEHR